MPAAGRKCVGALKDSVRAELLSIDNTFSGYNKGSLLIKVNNAQTTAPIEVNAMYADLFQRSYEIWKESGGAFDPTGGPLFNVWGFGFRNRENVNSLMVDSILTFVGMDKVKLDTVADNGGERYYLIKSDPRIRLNFNAIAQGYACDRLAGILDFYGVSDYLVDIGEIVCKGKNSKGSKWRVGIEKPEEGNQERGKDIQSTVDVTDCGIVTSGNYRKFYVENGKKYPHEIDPRTGYPVQHNLLSATVIACDGTTADAFSTWFMVIGLEKAQKAVADINDISAFFIYDDNGTLKTWSNVK
jgi:thiamine biosynthesis lipoprotein